MGRPHADGYRSFLILWGAQSLSMIGSGLTIFTLTLWVTQRLYPAPDQKSALSGALAALGLALALPTFIFAPLAGLLTDRWDRRRILVVTDLARALLSLIVLVLLVSGALTIARLVGVVLLFSIAGILHVSTFEATICVLVPPQRLARANGMVQTSSAVQGIVAPALAALLIALPGMMHWNLGSLGQHFVDGAMDGSALALGIDVLTFCIAGSASAFLRLPSAAAVRAREPGSQKSFWNDLLAGALFIRRRPVLTWLLITVMVVNLTNAPMLVLQPLVLRFDLAVDWAGRGFSFGSALALLETSAAVGGLAGGAAVILWGGLQANRVYGVLVPIVFNGLSMIVFGHSSRLYVSAAALGIAFAALPIMQSHLSAIWQMRTPHELQGRVFAIRVLVGQSTIPLGMVVVGIGGGRVNPGAIAMALGLLTLCFAGGQLFNRSMVSIDRVGTTREE